MASPLRVTSYADMGTERAWVAEARELRAKGLSYGEIGRRLDLTSSAVWKQLNPDAKRRYHDADNEARRGDKTRWQRDRRRQIEYRGRCDSCGGPMGVGKTKDGTCRTCLDRQITERRERVVQWWREGLTLREIAVNVGGSIGWVGQEINRMRKYGYDLPLRRPYYGNGREEKAA